MIKMPDPVAYLYKGVSVYLSNDGYGNDVSLVKMPKGYKKDRLGREVEPVDLITTTQAEAYKDACVREALEKAANKCKNSMLANTGAWCGATASHCAESILALIPKDQSCA